MPCTFHADEQVFPVAASSDTRRATPSSYTKNTNKITGHMAASSPCGTQRSRLSLSNTAEIRPSGPCRGSRLTGKTRMSGSGSGETLPSALGSRRKCSAPFGCCCIRKTGNDVRAVGAYKRVGEIYKDLHSCGEERACDPAPPQSAPDLIAPSFPGRSPGRALRPTYYYRSLCSSSFQLLVLAQCVVCHICWSKLGNWSSWAMLL